MWLIAGVMLAGIIFISAFSMITKYTTNMEVSQAEDNFKLLKDTINSVCRGGPYSQEINKLTFPYRMQRLSVQDDHGIRGAGKNLCIEIMGLPESCVELDICETEMNSINLERETSVFYLIDKAFGKKKPATLQFTVAKVPPQKVNVTWSHIVGE